VKNSALAAIDIGTNTLRLLIAEVNFDSYKDAFVLKELYSERTITRLGEGLHDTRLLKEETVKMSIDSLLNYVDTIQKYSIRHVSAVATGALREALNTSDFLERVNKLTGLDIKVISGEEEANLTAAGMLLEMEWSESAVLIDIGGGSTELIHTLGDRPVKVHSLNLGVVYLAGKYMTSDPPRKENIMKMEEEISRMTGQFHTLFASNIEHNTRMIGTAGTITTLSAIQQNLRSFEHDMIHNSVLKYEDVKNIFNKISAVSSAERALYIPFEPERLDIIVPGTLILLKLMETFNFDHVTVSDYGLREGILINLYMSLKDYE
jgi:exopolyphosphatase/guanosine-5'-triphosphate,3'-diphosphate pyrophosphatase